MKATIPTVTLTTGKQVRSIVREILVKNPDCTTLADLDRILYLMVQCAAERAQQEAQYKLACAETALDDLRQESTGGVF